ncbi:MAG: shikimate dehydrogenase [Candidatus Bathyarchaeia archaeon]
MTSPRISGKTTIYGIIGDPVDHSMSPIIQNVALRKMCIDAIYVPFHVKKSDLKRAVEGLVATRIRGFNVTAPHKVSIIRYLSSLDRNARDIQSVNTVINRNGVLEGFNTDGIGALRAIKAKRLHNASVLLFGAGGAARAIAHAYAPEVIALRIVNRTLSKGKKLERSIKKKFKRKIKIEAVSLDDKRIAEYVRSADVIVNASLMGMNDKNKLPVKADWFQSRQVVFDIVYNPVETELLRLAKSAGAGTVNGLEMLLNQGCCSFKLWTGLDAPITAMRRVMIDQLAEMYAQS